MAVASVTTPAKPQSWAETSLTGLKNRLLQTVARIAPGAGTLRVRLHRWRGVKIGEGVWIGYDAVIETSKPQLVTIGDEAVIEWTLPYGRRDFTAFVVSGAIWHLPRREARWHTLRLSGSAPHSVADEGIKESA